MKAIVCRKWGPPSDLSIEERSPPALGPGQVRIAVHAAAIGFQDILMIAGKYQSQPEFPFSPGNDVSGTVHEVGEGIHDLKTGDRVAAILEQGGYADEAIAARNAVVRIPGSIDFPTAASLGIAYGTAYQGLVGRAGIQSGEILLVRGAGGGTGLAAVEIAKDRGAEIIAAASSEEKREAARRAGAHHVIDTSAELVRDRVLEITNGRGADVIFDPVGSDFRQDCLRCIARRGRILIVGFAGGEIPDIPAHYLINKFCSIIGVAWGPTYLRHDRDDFVATFKSLVQMCAAGAIRPRIGRVVAPEEAIFALEAMAERRTIGRTVIAFR